jgi:hypothetical protein
MTTLARPQAVRVRDDGASIGVRDDGRLIGATIIGGAGALFGFGAFVAVVVGDDLIALDAISVAAASLAILGLLAAVFVRYLPGYGAIGMAAAPIGYLAAFGSSWGTWWARYQDAVVTSGAAENIFWSAMPAMALFTISGALLAISAFLAAFSAFSQSEG